MTDTYDVIRQIHVSARLGSMCNLGKSNLGTTY